MKISFNSPVVLDKTNLYLKNISSLKGIQAVSTASKKVFSSLKAFFGERAFLNFSAGSIVILGIFRLANPVSALAILAAAVTARSYVILKGQSFQSIKPLKSQDDSKDVADVKESERSCNSVDIEKQASPQVLLEPSLKESLKRPSTQVSNLSYSSDRYATPSILQFAQPTFMQTNVLKLRDKSKDLAEASVKTFKENASKEISSTKVDSPAKQSSIENQTYSKLIAMIVGVLGLDAYLKNTSWYKNYSYKPESKEAPISDVETAKDPSKPADQKAFNIPLLSEKSQLVINNKNFDYCSEFVSKFGMNYSMQFLNGADYSSLIKEFLKDLEKKQLEASETAKNSIVLIPNKSPVGLNEELQKNSKLSTQPKVKRSRREMNSYHNSLEMIRKELQKNTKLSTELKSRTVDEVSRFPNTPLRYKALDILNKHRLNPEIRLHLARCSADFAKAFSKRI